MFYDRFVELCRQRQVSPSFVMREIGLNKSNATFWKQGSIPKGATLHKLAEYFDVSIDYLLDFTNEYKEALQLDEDQIVELMGIDRELVKRYLFDEAIAGIPHEIYGQAIESADNAVVEKFKAVSDAQLRKYLLEFYKSLNRRGRIEAVLRMSELSEDYRFKKRTSDPPQRQSLSEPLQPTPEPSESKDATQLPSTLETATEDK